MLVAILLVVDLLRVISAAATTSSSSSTAQCYEQTRDYYPYFSTKTAYELVHGHVSRLENGCKPVQIWMLARHGTRYPGASQIPAMLNLTIMRDRVIHNHQQGAGLLCSTDLERLRDWQPDANFRWYNGDRLVEQGERDLRELAARLKAVFPNLLDTASARPGDFVFRATDTQRTQASLQAFARGLLGDDQRSARIQMPPVNDTLLAAFDRCPAWKSGYELERVDEQRDKFTEGPEVRAVLWNVARRLGFAEALDFETVLAMYDVCRFETAWHPNRMSPWCRVFRGDELKVFEYREDLDYYYFAGPGRSMSAKIGCQTLSDMFEHFKALATGNFTNQPKGVFYFAHTITLHTLMAALTISEEPVPLLARNYADLKNRHYRTSLLGPFATNVVAVFYSCNGSTSPYKVALFTAERQETISGCKDGVCDWKFFEQKFAPKVNQCSMDFCYDRSAASIANLTYSMFILLVAVALSMSVNFS